MSEDFVKFLILKVLAVGSIYRIVMTGDWEDRFPVNVEDVEFEDIKLVRLQETSHQEIGLQEIVTIEAHDRAGQLYGGHFVSDWDDLLQEYAQTFTFKIVQGGLEKI